MNVDDEVKDVVKRGIVSEVVHLQLVCHEDGEFDIVLR